MEQFAAGLHNCKMCIDFSLKGKYGVVQVTRSLVDVTTVLPLLLHKMSICTEIKKTGTEHIEQNGHNRRTVHTGHT
jgi:hypothetical protein